MSKYLSQETIYNFQINKLNPTFLIFCEFFGIFLFFTSFAPFYYGDFETSQKFFDKVHRSQYRLKNSAKIEKNKPRVRNVG
jgi:hypothetical protein